MLCRATVWSDGKYGIIDSVWTEISPLAYKSETERLIWENLHLSEFIQQVKDYDKSSGNSGSFPIRKPYIIGYDHYPFHPVTNLDPVNGCLESIAFIHVARKYIIANR